MPIPIMPVNVDALIRQEMQAQNPAPTVDYNFIDVSSLPISVEKRSKTQDLVKVSNFEAGLLFRLWNDSGAGPNDEGVSIPQTVTNSDVLRLKASGLIMGDTEKFTLTDRGKHVLVTMVLGEKNNFDKTSGTKSFEQIVSENKKKASGGPRLSVGKPKK